ncbi:MAG TPA: aspartate 1-decarboxylase [Candidatus Kapabacteria bacterium]|jgi:aspartate 1-decarboxylase|nr:aspartate 1-decarboxylase [Candidatus Kapabacteria bacterium]
MKRILFKSKVHRATITQAELYYEGSLTLDADLMRAAEMLPFEKVAIVNVNNGERFETYLISGPAGSGVVCLNGAAARKGSVGDEIIIITYGEYEDTEELRYHRPTVVQVDKSNKIKKITNGIEAYSTVN